MSKSSKVCGVGCSDWVVKVSDVDIVIDSKTVTEEGLPFFLASLESFGMILLLLPFFSWSSSKQLLAPPDASPGYLTLVRCHLPYMHPNI